MKPLAKQSASLILLKQAKGQNYKVLMIKRKQSMSFSSAYVFPGGASEIEDSSDDWITSQNVTRDFTHEVSYAPTIDLTSLKITAIRETYEETGILVGSNTNFRKTESGAEFLNQCKEKGTKLYLDKLQYVMRVITPEIFKPRFDTTFFLCNLEEEKTEIDLDTGESEDFIWEEPCNILEYFKQKKLILFPPQILILHQLDYYHDFAKLQQVLSRLRPVPIIPEISEVPKEMLLLGDYRHPHTPSELRDARYEHFFRFDPNNTCYRCSSGLSRIFSRL